MRKLFSFKKSKGRKSNRKKIKPVSVIKSLEDLVKAIPKKQSSKAERHYTSRKSIYD